MKRPVVSSEYTGEVEEGQIRWELHHLGPGEWQGEEYTRLTEPHWQGELEHIRDRLQGFLRPVLDRVKEEAQAGGHRFDPGTLHTAYARRRLAVRELASIG